ncbi:biopolymer transporter ExbD [Epibacterium ulvae]|uniref:biopolymer transporter ExbD n=1 Tax=Epibacterium ulvae TaxID=1156985 RepID=UPI001BFCC70B|nr:biopolymer transporter ExbD [Epibacterium ulvae]MBT8155630.1 biopolymer transporter ExbD [Epibacterium ulvae]
MPSRPKKTRRALSVTSLIDVIFLLLLFFMLSSTFTKFSEVALMTSGQGDSVAPSDRTVMFLRLNGDQMSLNGQPLAPDTLGSALQTPDQKPPSVLISLTSATSAQHLTDALVILRALPDLSLTVLDPT